MHYEFIIFDEKDNENLLALKLNDNGKYTLLANFKHVATLPSYNYVLMSTVFGLLLFANCKRLVLRLVNCDEKLTFSEQVEHNEVLDPNEVYKTIDNYVEKVKC